jgi:ABC-type multidrug transport system fused ATPase/permease subunit
LARNSRFESQDEIPKKKVTRESLSKEFSYIFKFIKPYQGYFVVGFICLIMTSLLSLTFPYLSGKLVNAADGKVQGLSVNDIGMMLIGVLLVNAVFAFLRIQTFAVVSEKALRDIRIAVYDKLIHLPVPFFEESRVGELTSRITSDVQQLQDILSWTLAEFIRQFLTLTVGILALFIWYPRLTLFMVATFPVLVVGAIIFGRYIRKLAKKTQDSLANANSVVVETLQSVNTVKAFTNESYETGRYTSALESVLKNALNGAKYRGLFASFIIFVLFGGIVAIIWYAATLYQQKQIFAGDLIGFTMYTAFIGASVAGLGELYPQLQRTIGASERIREILAKDNETTLLPVKHKLEKTGDIVFENVSFSYPTRPDIAVLENISLKIKAGQKIALVGHSGAGKSTITSLLLHYYPLTSGSITINNIDIEAIDLKELRSHIGIVPQEVLLFGGTIAENIAYGKPGASLEDIKLAAAKANALEFIDRFPDGFNTVVGERGIKLSGGQRQRIAIARAILKDPEILILDEATSSLDAESERLVQDALDKLMHNRTTIIIAHRLATIRNVDYVYVINNKHIEEAGTHDELAEKESGIFSKLLRLQFELD